MYPVTVKERMESAIQAGVDCAIKSLMEVLVVKTAANLTLRFEEQFGSAIGEVRAFVAASEQTALARAGTHTANVKSRLMRYFRDELSTLQVQQHADATSMTVLQTEVRAVSKMVYDFQQRLELRLKYTRKETIERAEAAVVEGIQSRSAELERKLTSLMDQGEPALVDNGEDTADANQAGLVATVCDAIDRLAVTLAVPKAAALPSSSSTTLHKANPPAYQPKQPADASTATNVDNGSTATPTSTEIPAITSGDTATDGPALTLRESKCDGLQTLPVSDEVTTEIDKMLNDAPAKATEHAKANASIRLDLNELQKSERSQVTGDKEKRLQQLAPELLAKLRQLEREMDDK